MTKSNEIFPRISIAMATYNGARYIQEQLDSIAAQCLLPYELVVTDDGSTDATLELVAEFASTAPFPVNIHRNVKRLGFADNFLYAASLCSGDLIAFCDQDDIWKANKLACCAASFDRPDVLLCVHSAELIDSLGKSLGRNFPVFKSYKPYANSKLPDTFYYGFTLVFRRYVLNILSEVSPLSYLGHDTYLGFICTSLGDVVYLSETLARYRQHGLNTCGAPAAIAFDKIIAESRSAGARHYFERSRDAKLRSDVLTQLGANLKGKIGLNARRGAAREERRSATFRRRAERYETSSPFARWLGLIKAVMFGDYGRRCKGGLGVRGVAKDFVHLVMPSLLMRVQHQNLLDKK